MRQSDLSSFYNLFPFGLKKENKHLSQALGFEFYLKFTVWPWASQ